MTQLRNLPSRLREERGVVLVEFAIVLPVLLLIILGILYFGRYENYSNQVTQLAEEGARAAALGNWPGWNSTPAVPLQSYIQAQAMGELSGGTAQVWVYLPSGGSYAIGQSIHVCVTAQGAAPPTGGSGPLLVGAATMRVEQVQSGWTSTTSTPFDSTNPTGTRPSQCPTS